MPIVKNWIQCPTCDQFVAKASYVPRISKYKCDGCGTFTVEDYEAGNKRRAKKNGN